MSDAVLAAIIAATATLCASFLQLRVALAKEADARSRGQPISRRRSRLPMILIGVMLVASAVGGFALSQWLGGSQRTAQADLQRELRDRLTELGMAVTALQRLAAMAPAGPAASVDTALTAQPDAVSGHAIAPEASPPPPGAAEDAAAPASTAPAALPVPEGAAAPILAQAPAP
ncbi:MAG: hypothetical protein IT480_08085 [Gammaproteobacteria bacterium]|nr:hypothetical protein [Gammaproteobacteria bacterium]